MFNRLEQTIYNNLRWAVPIALALSGCAPPTYLQEQSGEGFVIAKDHLPEQLPYHSFGYAPGCYPEGRGMYFCIGHPELWQLILEKCPTPGIVDNSCVIKTVDVPEAEWNGVHNGDYVVVADGEIK